MGWIEHIESESLSITTLSGNRGKLFNYGEGAFRELLVPAIVKGVKI